MSQQIKTDPYLESLISEFDKLRHTSRRTQDEDHMFNLHREIVEYSEEEIRNARAHLRQIALQNTR